MYIHVTRFEWDESKNRRNLAKHGISFATAILIFEDPHVVSEFDRVVDGEQRWLSVGAVGGVAIVVVAHTVRLEGAAEEVIRVISARKATPGERDRYSQAL